MLNLTVYKKIEEHPKFSGMNDHERRSMILFELSIIAQQLPHNFVAFCVNADRYYENDLKYTRTRSFVCKEHVVRFETSKIVVVDLNFNSKKTIDGKAILYKILEERSNHLQKLQKVDYRIS